MSYFSNNFEKLALLQKNVPTDKGLRECQMGAYWAVNAHFTSSEEPALVVMPTGSGKTALLMLLCFGFKAKRVLVVTPSAVLRDQLKDNFKELTDLTMQGVLPIDVDKPKVGSQKLVIKSNDQWEKLEEFDVVVSTPHTISPKYHKTIVPPPPEGLFDVVIFDEAHHIRAPSWEELLNLFGSSKKVLLTATPFRLDELKMIGRMVYNYPIERAISNKIYQKIEYRKVSVGDQDRNQALCDTVKAIVITEKESGLNPKILVRTDKVKKSNSLIELYSKNGLKIRRVDYTQSLNANEKVLTALKEDKIDGIVCVGMLGEGIDIPALKIAVLHDPPKSFPLTIQFVGRICRPNESEKAYVIADPKQIMEADTRGELRRLYGYDKKGWHDLIPEMVEEVIGRETEFLSLPYQLGAGSVSFQDIKPFYSIELYRINQAQLNLSASLVFPENMAVFELPTINANLRAIITQRIASPAWASNLSKIRELAFDLHLYYYLPESGFLFQSTTFEPIAEQIRYSMTNMHEEKLLGEELIKALRSDEHLNFNMIGLASSIGTSPSIPSYKTLMGREVEASIVPTDSHIFVAGHALARKKTGETIGFSSRQGKIWSLKRGTIQEFILWCDQISNNIIAKASDYTLRDIPYLNPVKTANEFSAEPVLITIDPHINECLATVIHYKNDIENKAMPVVNPVFEKVNYTDKKLFVIFYPNYDDKSFSINMSFDITVNSWTIADDGYFILKLESLNSNETLRPRLETAFREDFPPFIYLSNCTLISGKTLVEPKAEYSGITFPESCFVTGLNWNTCDIEKEYLKPEDTTKKNIHDWLESWLMDTDNLPQDSIIFKDHETGEIADFIAIQPNKKIVSFYHCKSSPTKGPGASIAHISAVMDQVLRSISLINTRTLIDKILDNSNGGRPKSRFLKDKDDRNIVAQMKDTFSPLKWTYEVVIVQPGLDCKKAAVYENTKILLLTCYEWLKDIGAKFKVMGFYEG